ncbi:pectate lyase [Dyadobacter tibetensis]|uniref:pectate lyase n=1 Tax=Dyadobacter tibetensis TaxID=1211851 RepID=UPI00046E8B97|nr:pectate lyase [Dyadobacter tibetensis]
MRPIIISLLACILSNYSDLYGQITEKNWSEVVYKMPKSWYGSEEAIRIAENLLIAQKSIGGWEKNKPYHKMLSTQEKIQYHDSKNKLGATFDNGATTSEMLFLAKVYGQTRKESFRVAFNKGLDYIYLSQYKNGGWPQFFPVRTGSVQYSAHITYNDDAMVNIMKFLKKVYTNDSDITPLELSQLDKERALKAYRNGIRCILDTQILVNGKPTVWCAQHDEKTLLPAQARSYELPSFSGSESVGIVNLLLQEEYPSQRIKEAVQGAMIWFESHKIEGIRIETETTAQNTKNRVVVTDPDAPAVWARFYDLETAQPFFCDRDGIKKKSLAEIGDNRRNGYSWYTSRPASLYSQYALWKEKFN